MNLRHLRYFVAVAEEMNLTRAAERLHTSQPALSVQIRKLEKELDVELFDRVGRGIALTKAGEVFLERTRRSLAEMDRTIALAQLAAKGEIGQLSIGYEISTEFRIFPRIIPGFRTTWPNVHLNFINLKSHRVFEGILDDELDVGFAFLPASESEFDITPLIEVKVIVAIPAQHRLASKQAIAFSDLSDEPLIMFAASLDPDFHREIEMHFRSAGANMNVVLETSNLLSAINFISMGIGCCLVGDQASSLDRQGVVYRPLEPPGFVKKLAVIKSKRSSQTVDKFYAYICRHAADDPGNDQSGITWSGP